MHPQQKRLQKAHGIRVATGGLLLALALIGAVKLLGFAYISWGGWLAAVSLTLVVQAALWLVARHGLDERIPGDRHFLYVPMVTTVLLLGTYILLAPQLRVMILLGWFVALLFMAGLGGFRDVAALSGLMVAAYLAAAALLLRRGLALSFTFEASVAGVLFAMSLYAGLVFERLRRDRIEMKRLRSRLAQMALTDALTELPNRRHFEQVLHAELDRVQRHGGHCTIAIADVDHFKHYNDALGHIAGDSALRELAAVMRRQLRLHDMVARYGGEEFALILVNATKDEAYQTVERLRAVVEDYPFRHRDVQPGGRLTISAGIATFPDDSGTYDDLLKQADDALYLAKRSGRNQVRLAEPVRTA